MSEKLVMMDGNYRDECPECGLPLGGHWLRCPRCRIGFAKASRESYEVTAYGTAYNWSVSVE